MAAGSSKPKGRKGKLGKNKSRIRAYYESGRYYWNKARKLTHHLRKAGDDKPAIEARKAALAGMPLHLEREFKRTYNI